MTSFSSPAFVWIYHGLVRKILAPDAGELELLANAGGFLDHPRLMITVIGIAEIAFGVAVVAW